MAEVAREDLQWLGSDAEATATDERGDWDGDGESPSRAAVPDAAGIESLRTAFVDAFNARDLDSLLDLVAEDVEFGDAAVEGPAALADELVAIWERSPGVLLTRAYADDTPCAVAWRPDEDGCWCRAALLSFDVDGEAITLIEIPDDPDALATAVTEDPSGDEVDEWLDWSEYESGHESPTERR